MKKRSFIFLALVIGYTSGLLMEIPVMGDESKLLYFANTGIIDTRWIPTFVSETYTKQLSLEKKASSEFHSFSLIKSASLSESFEESLGHLAISLNLGRFIVDPTPDDITSLPNDSGDEYFSNEVTDCKFHSEQDISNIECVICRLGDGEYVVGEGELEIDPDIGYFGSSTLEIPITEPPSPNPSKAITNVMSVSIDFCMVQDGCTPGYWKQSQHFDSWVNYSPNQSFDEIFDDDSFDTLLDALEAGGGGINALGRHTVAALLSAASSDVNYLFTEQQVIDKFNDAILNGNYEQVKDIFAEQNELGCPLN